jgi:hypothetical protein
MNSNEQEIEIEEWLDGKFLGSRIFTLPKEAINPALEYLRKHHSMPAVPAVRLFKRAWLRGVNLNATP